MEKPPLSNSHQPYPTALPLVRSRGVYTWTLTNYKSQGDPRRLQHKRKNNSTNEAFPRGRPTERGSPHKRLRMEEWEGFLLRGVLRGKINRRETQLSKKKGHVSGIYLPLPRIGSYQHTVSIHSQWVHTAPLRPLSTHEYLVLLPSRDKAHWELSPEICPQ